MPHPFSKNPHPELRDCPSCGEPVGKYSLSCPKCGTNWQVRFFWKYYVPIVAVLVCLALFIFFASKTCQRWEGDGDYYMEPIENRDEPDEGWPSDQWKAPSGGEGAE